MTRNLRISLTILSVGFGIEGVGELYTQFGGGTSAPGLNLLYILPLLLTAVGLLFVWVGRDEWNAVHRAHVSMASRVFALSLLGGVVAAVVLGLLVAVPSLGVPDWAAALFAAAVASLVFGTFVTYAYLVFHLTSNVGKVAVGLSLLWAFAVSVAVAIAIAASVPSILTLIADRALSVPAFVAPVDRLISFLFLSYFLLLVGYVEAHREVARGLRTDPTLTGPTGAR
jgi:uncharacterized membrane protein YidH (DUF202 family)